MNIFITGANRGLGFELTKLSLSKGNTVFAGVYLPDGAQPLEELNDIYPDTLVIIPLDVSKDESVAGAVKTIEQYSGALDCVVNNAGILLNKHKKIDELDIQDLRLTFEINTFGPYRVLQGVLPLLYKGDEKVIINIASEAASITNVGTEYCSYSMSKVAVTMMSQMFANLLSEKGFKVYAIHPGRMNTVMGKETAQIEPSESAVGIYDLITGKVQPKITNGVWFINYRGEPMEL
jgi:NAD(P)-dependent dehydrogenase (short-subunit alcohol dehydrogenase family)